jgi:branched-chain amino acid transport system ATP-binding protein
MAVLLAALGLAKHFGGVHAVRDLSFAVERGLVYSIIGPNGAGKTTLLNLLTGLYKPDAGRIELAGRDVTALPPHRWAEAGLARTFQNLQVFFNMSALENVMVGRHLHEEVGLAAALLHLPRLARAEHEARERAAALMQRVGLAAYLDAPAEGMPYGALKRLEIARALAAEPALLLLDEPAAGLNHTEAQQIDALVRELAGEGRTVVLVEHNMRLVMEVSDRVLVLERGQRLAEGTPAEVARDARVIEAYLGAPAASAAGAAAHA